MKWWKYLQWKMRWLMMISTTGMFFSLKISPWNLFTPWFQGWHLSDYVFMLYRMMNGQIFLKFLYFDVLSLALFLDDGFFFWGSKSASSSSSSSGCFLLFPFCSSSSCSSSSLLSSSSMISGLSCVPMPQCCFLPRYFYHTIPLTVIWIDCISGCCFKLFCSLRKCFLILK